MRVCHEDVVADFPSVAAGLSEAFGVLLDPCSALDIPGIEKQADSLSAEWKVRYLEDLQRQPEADGAPGEDTSSPARQLAG